MEPNNKTTTDDNNASASRAQFDKQAANYNERWASWSDETLRRVLEFADPQAHWTVLDIATATGFTALAVAPHVRHVTGSDVSTKMLEQANLRAREQGIENVTWTVADAHDLPFANAVFDLVTVRIAPHHFADVPRFLREVRRVLRAGGVFVLGDTTVPDNGSEAADWQNRTEKLRDGSHYANLSPETWRGLCETSGLVVTDLDAGLENREVVGIPIQLGAWLNVAGCEGEQGDAVRAMFRDVPASARAAFQIIGDDGADDTRFVWRRVVLRAVKPTDEPTATAAVQ